jgi:hypothetical protein
MPGGLSVFGAHSQFFYRDYVELGWWTIPMRRISSA